MRKAQKYFLSMWLLLFAAVASHAQVQRIPFFEVDKGKVIFSLDLTLPPEEILQLARAYRLDSLPLDSLLQYGRAESLEKQGWHIQQPDEQVIQLIKAVEDLQGNLHWQEKLVLAQAYNLQPGMPGLPGPVAYGVNQFERQTIFPAGKGLTAFTLPGFENAYNVYLSGSFNQWSTLKTPMRQTNWGWVTEMRLPPGKYLYKFIVDGRWMHDPNNTARERDGHGGWNSAVFIYNHEFVLPGFTGARKVTVAGSFNGWNQNELEMKPDGNGWRLPLYLADGTHTYKYIVDGQWKLDTGNPRVRKDSEGNLNHVLEIGTPLYFYLPAYKQAGEVVLAGEFNGWNTRDLRMALTDSGWVLPYVLGSGNYAYKYLVDGRWRTDPVNPHLQGPPEEENSLCVVQPTHTFVLKGYPHAGTVRVTGTFNNWDTHGYTLRQTGSGWQISLHLPEGKHLYKFIVDGEWIKDPDNPYWEENEFHTGNSVLWLR